MVKKYMVTVIAICLKAIKTMMRYILLYRTIYLISAKYYMLKVRLDNCF